MSSANLPTIDIRACGADPNNSAESPKALQAAADKCAAAGGGTVLVPRGTWQADALRLSANVCLRLLAGAHVQGAMLIEDAENVSVIGDSAADSVIDSVRCARSRNLRLEKYGGRVTSFHDCDQGVVRGLRLYQAVQRQGEGSAIWLWGCNDFDFADCDLFSNDDVFCIKSHGRNIHIRRSVLSGRLAAAYKIGTETGGAIEHVSFTDSVVLHSDRAAISLESVDGTHLRNVLIAGIRMVNVTAPLFIRLGNRDRFARGIGSISDVTLADIDASGLELCDGTGSSITGLPGHPIENVRLHNVRLLYRGGMERHWAARAVPELPNTYPEYDIFGVLPAWGLWCRHVRGLQMRNVTLRTAQPDLRPALMCEHVQDLDIDRLDAIAWPDSHVSLRHDCGSLHYRYPAENPAAEPAVELRNVTRVFLHDCAAPHGVPLARVRGAATNQVTLRDNRAVAGLPVNIEVGQEVAGALSIDESTRAVRIDAWQPVAAADDTTVPDDPRPPRTWLEHAGDRREMPSIAQAIAAAREGDAILLDGCHRLSPGQFPLIMQTPRLTLRSLDPQRPARLMGIGAGEEMGKYAGRNKRRETLQRGALLVLAADGIVIERLCLSGALFNVLAEGVAGCVLRHNRFEFGKRWHMYFIDCRDFQLLDNHTQASLNCLCTMDRCHNFTIRGHISRHDPAGFRLAGCTGNLIESCEFHAISWDAVLLGPGCRDNRVIGNQFLGGRLTGLQLRNAHGNRIERNVFRNHRTEAVLVDQGASNNRLRLNHFEGNRSLAVSNETGSPVDARENWWAHPQGPSTPATPGPGDMVDANVVYEPYLTEPQ